MRVSHNKTAFVMNNINTKLYCSFTRTSITIIRVRTLSTYECAHYLHTSAYYTHTVDLFMPADLYTAPFAIMILYPHAEGFNRALFEPSIFNLHTT